MLILEFSTIGAVHAFAETDSDEVDNDESNVLAIHDMDAYAIATDDEDIAPPDGGLRVGLGLRVT